MVGKTPRLPASMEELEASGMKEFDTLSERGNEARTLFNIKLTRLLTLEFTEKMREAFTKCMIKSSKQYVDMSKNADPRNAEEVFNAIFTSFLNDLIGIAKYLSEQEGYSREKGLFSECGIYLQIHDGTLAQYSKVMEILIDAFVKMKKETPQGHTLQTPHNINVNIKTHPFPQAMYPMDSDSIRHPLYGLEETDQSGNPIDIASIFFYTRHPYSMVNEGRKEPNDISKLFSELAHMYFRQITNQFDTHVTRTGINRASSTAIDFPKK